MGHVAVDLGERRIGVAVADDPDGRARAHSTVRRGATPAADARLLAPILVAADAHELVVGHPLEANGDEGPQARATRAWSEAISVELGVPVRLRDERLTSHLAEERLGPMKRGRSGGPPTPTQRRAYRARVDREAAAIILQDELDARSRDERHVEVSD
jgi:putative Holliday junction resolvase